MAFKGLKMLPHGLPSTVNLPYPLDLYLTTMEGIPSAPYAFLKGCLTKNLMLSVTLELTAHIAIQSARGVRRSFYYK